MLPVCSEFHNQPLQIYGYVFHDINGKILVRHRRSSGSSWTKFVRTPICWTLVGTWMGQRTELGMSICSLKTSIIVIGIRGWHQREKQNMAHMSKKLMKHVHRVEPTSFPDHVYLGCTQRECFPNEVIIEQYREMFESRISAGATEKLPGWENPYAKTVPWSNDMKGHAQECVGRYWELANKKTEQFFNVSSPCLDDHHFKKEELESVGELSTVCSQIVLKCLYLAWIGRPDILWSVNKLARSVTEWTRACGRLLAILISYIHHTSDHTGQHCQLGLFQDSDFAGDLEDSKYTTGRNVVYIWKSDNCHH